MPAPRLRTAAAAFAAALLLTGCAPAADDTWQPTPWESGGSLIPVVNGGADATHDEGSAEPAVATSEELGFVEGRIRNDGAALQARYAHIPGSHPFNDRVFDVIRTAVAGTGVHFVPEAFPIDAALADRGCTEGALTADAKELLADPLTGPVTGTGTAVVCEPVDAFDSVVAVGIRTIVGGPEVPPESTSDRTTVIYGDLASGEAFDGTALWQENAAEELWFAAVETLRRDAGALSAAPFAAPDETQLALAHVALGSVRLEADGGARFRLPSGVHAPELADLGIAPTTEAMDIVFAASTIDDWQTELGADLRARVGTPFSGMPAWTAAHPVDCSLLSCVALTYDDGPSGHTAQLLDTLQAYRAPATFYMLGPAAQGAPDLVARAASEGHELGSHTMTHPELTGVSAARAKQEVDDAAAILEGISGLPAPTFRPPYGAVNDAVIAAVGRPAIMWSIDTNDWQRPGIDELIRRSVDPAAPGNIILYHDTHADSVAAAPAILEGLYARGFTPVTVSQLFDGAVPEGRVTGR